MSEKFYTPDQVAKEVLKKYHTLAKGLFSTNEIKCEATKSQDSKESVFHEIKWALDDIKRLKELSWTVEQEAPSAKDLFEKEFEKAKDKLATLVRRHKALKKSEEDSEEEKEILSKAETVDEMWKAEVEKCGEMKKDETAKNPKLKEFLDKKKAKKTSKMEKMLGMNTGMAPAAQASTQSPSTPSIASQIGWPGTKK